MIKIDKGIPVPERRTYTGKWKKVFAMMKTGDSFSVISTDIATLRGSLRHYQQYHAPKSEWTIRKTEDGHYRCWRTK